MHMFELSTGELLNLDHVVEIPSRSSFEKYEKSSVSQPIMITMVTGKVRFVMAKDAAAISAYMLDQTKGISVLRA